jgi:hypothetical protein
LSSEQEEERTEYVQREKPVQPTVGQPVIVQSPAPPAVREQFVSVPANMPVLATIPPESERKESVVRKTSTNTGAIVAMLVGVAILLFGIFLVFTKVFPYLGYPWSLLAVLLVAVVFMIVGGSLLQERSRV